MRQATSYYRGEPSPAVPPTLDLPRSGAVDIVSRTDDDAVIVLGFGSMVEAAAWLDTVRDDLTNAMVAAGEIPEPVYDHVATEKVAPRWIAAGDRVIVEVEDVNHVVYQHGGQDVLVCHPSTWHGPDVLIERVVSRPRPSGPADEKPDTADVHLLLAADDDGPF